jgi:hypothetical protein
VQGALASALALTPPAFACRDARAHAHDLLEGTLKETTRAEIQQTPRHLPELPSRATSSRRRTEVRDPDGILRARLDELVREADEAP